MRFFWLVAAIGCISCSAGAQILYQSNTGAAFSNFIPFGPDGTPNRPAPGDHLGNQITLAGTNRLLDDIQASFGLNTNFGQNPNPATDFYTADLYKNDGAGGAPGTLFASSKVIGTTPGVSVLSLTFPFETVVPDTFTVVLSSTHPTNSAGTLVGVAGPYNSGGNPGTGSAINTVWYNTNAAATTWVSNSTWAPNDGAATNFFTMTLDGATGVAFNNGAISTVNTAVNDRAIVSNHTAATFNAGGNVSVTHFGSGVSAVIVTDTSRVTNTAANFSANISSGGFTTDVANGLKALDNSVVTISGGQVHGNISSGGGDINTANGLWALGSSTATVTGGDFLGAISSGGGCINTASGIMAGENAHVTILGGKFTGSISGGDTNSSNGLIASGNAVISIAGGDFIGDTHDLLLQDNAQVTLIGTNFNSPYGSLAALSGNITGILENGQTVDFSFVQNHAGQIVLSPVPEPMSLFLVVTGFLLNLRRSRRRLPAAARACIQALETRCMLSGGLDFSGGFDPAGSDLELSGASTITPLWPSNVGSVVQVAGPAMAAAPQDITNFSTHFSEQAIAFNEPSCGLTFVIENANSQSFDGNQTSDGGLGYQGIPNSIAIKLDLWDDAGEGASSTGLFIDGDAPTVPSPSSPHFSQEANFNLTSPDNDYKISGINLHSSDVMDVGLDYDGSTLRETITDTVTGIAFTHTYTSLDIPGIINSTTARIGFTGGVCSDGQDQDILSWNYTNLPAPTAPVAPSNLSAISVSASETDLTWQNNDSTPNNGGFVVYRSGGGDNNFYPIASLPLTATSYADTQVPSTLIPTQRLWEYRVAAHNSGGLSDFADALASTPAGPPTNVAAIASGNTAVISWIPVNGVTSYNLYRWTAGGSPSATPYMTGLTGVSVTDSAISAGTTYFYQLTAVSGSTETTPSDQTSTRLNGGLTGSYFPGQYSPAPLPTDDQALVTRQNDTSQFPNAVAGYFDTGDLDPIESFPVVSAGGRLQGPNTGNSAVDNNLDSFETRWEGTFTPLTSEDYTFASVVSGHVITATVWVNGQEVVSDQTGGSNDLTTEITLGDAIHLTAGTAYPIQIDLFTNAYPGGPPANFNPPGCPSARFALGFETSALSLHEVPLSLLSNVAAAPPPPTNLQVSDLSYRNFSLAWQGSPDSCSYIVQESTDGVNYSTIQADVPLDGPLANSLAVSGVAEGMSYHIRVVAESAAGVTASAPILVNVPSTHGAPFDRWLFNDGALAAAAGQDPSSVTTAADTNVVGPPNNGTLSGPVWVTGTTGQPAALKFTGGGGVTLTNDMLPLLDGTATLAAWIKTTQVGGDYGGDSPAILGSYDSISGDDVSWGMINHKGQIGLSVAGGEAISHQAINDNQWHLVAFSRDSLTGEEDVYVDGNLSGTYQGAPGTVEEVFGYPYAENLQTIGAESIMDTDGDPHIPVDFQYFNGMLRDVRAYNRILSAQEVADLFSPPTPSAPTTVSPSTIAVDLQSAIVNGEGDPTQPPAAFEATTSDQVTAFLNAVDGVFVSPSSQPVNVTLNAPGITVQASQVTVPKNMVLTINGVTFDPDVPALTLNLGNLTLTNCTLITTGNAPTILVNDGNLTLRNDIIQESSSYAQAAIEIDGGSVDLGSASDPGGNTLDVNGAGVALRSGSSGPLIPLDPSAGNTLQINGHTASADDNLQGLVWTDFNNDGFVDFGEAGIGNIPITLSGTNLLGNHIQQTLNTDANGIYSFPLLWPGTYSITEGATPSSYIEGRDSLGTLGGDASVQNVFSNIPVGVNQNGVNYNFGERPAPGSAVAKGQAAGIGFWANKNGQALINNFASIGNWLAATMPNTFGTNAAINLHGMSSAQVAGIFLNDFLLKDKLDAQVMATALNVYATDASLGGSAASSYGFTVDTYGLGDSMWNVGSDGAAFNVASNSTLTVMQILQDWDQQNNRGNKTIRQLALDVFGGINSKGGL